MNRKQILDRIEVLNRELKKTETAELLSAGRAAKKWAVSGGQSGPEFAQLRTKIFEIFALEEPEARFESKPEAGTKPEEKPEPKSEIKRGFYGRS